jgi:hypothetical protein
VMTFALDIHANLNSCMLKLNDCTVDRGRNVVCTSYMIGYGSRLRIAVLILSLPLPLLIFPDRGDSDGRHDRVTIHCVLRTSSHLDFLTLARVIC